MIRESFGLWRPVRAKLFCVDCRLYSNRISSIVFSWFSFATDTTNSQTRDDEPKAVLPWEGTSVSISKHDFEDQKIIVARVKLSEFVSRIAKSGKRSEGAEELLPGLSFFILSLRKGQNYDR